MKNNKKENINDDVIIVNNQFNAKEALNENSAIAEFDKIIFALEQSKIDGKLNSDLGSSLTQILAKDIFKAFNSKDVALKQHIKAIKSDNSSIRSILSKCSTVVEHFETNDNITLTKEVKGEIKISVHTLKSLAETPVGAKVPFKELYENIKDLTKNLTSQEVKDINALKGWFNENMPNSGTFNKWLESQMKESKIKEQDFFETNKNLIAKGYKILQNQEKITLTQDTTSYFELLIKNFALLSEEQKAILAGMLI